MRRAVLILMTLVLAPSMAMGSRYQCAYDGIVRSVCCCPMETDESDGQNKAPAPDASLRATCCCTVIDAASRVPEAEARVAASIHIEPAVVATISAMAPPRIAFAARAVDRPRALGDPPDTLFARRCSLLL